ncbi:DUF3574 domain-containing protein [Niabella sp. CC-SYL272]|uniref:DUF3574 domain-containing protein n=1 Tax=Niabella agricola TaxID=2891571 RepID=UPI001F41A948|nr:DUF3574 domain-containing protein [Niabella agricola]MCF3112079.1 DUF3574 domain-containing protein [Niabella agricola]
MILIKQILLIAFAGTTITGCVTMQQTDLYFGRNIPGGGQVTEQQWKAFSDSIITPAFPEGYTESDAQGKWMDTESRETIAEDTKRITVIGKRSAKRNGQLNQITQAYIRRFHQQAVLRVDTKIRYRLNTKKNTN